MATHFVARGSKYTWLRSSSSPWRSLCPLHVTHSSHTYKASPVLVYQLETIRLQKGMQVTELRVKHNEINIRNCFGDERINVSQTVPFSRFVCAASTIATCRIPNRLIPNIVWSSRKEKDAAFFSITANILQRIPRLCLYPLCWPHRMLVFRLI